MSIKGPGLKIMAIVLAVVALGAGIYMTMFQSAGFKKTTATIVSIKLDPDYIPDPDVENDVQHIIMVKYTVDGKEYNTRLDSDSATYKVGGTVEIHYDPKDPGKITSNQGFGLYLMIAGGVILLVVVVLTIKKRMSVKQVMELNGGITFAPSVKGEERKLYFLTDTGTPKYGHRIEDKFRNVLYEAKMTKFTTMNPFGFDFIDYEHGTTTPHLIGHEEASENNFIIFDNHYTFTFDGEDIWKLLKRHKITVDSKLSVSGTTYRIFRDGEELAFVETSSQYVHEEDAEEHSVASKVPVPGFYRITTRETNLDLLFTTVLAFARSGALDDRGGTYKAMFNTIRK